MQIRKIAFFITFSLFSSIITADNKIIGFFEPIPHGVLNSVQQELFGKNSKPTLGTPSAEKKKNSKLTFKQGGFPMLYGGFLSYGKSIEFPLRHTNPKLYIVITPSIKVVPIEGETLRYLTLGEQKNPEPKLEPTLSTTSTPGMQAIIEKDSEQAEPKIYLLEKKQDEKKVWYWAISEDKLPEKGKISPISLILVTNPKNIFIKTGAYKSTEETHLRLPPIYITGEIDYAKNLSKFMDLSKYFEPLAADTKKDEDKKITQAILLNN